MTDPTPADTIAPGTPRAEGVLLPCPFCGHKAERMANVTHGDMSMVQCVSCGASAYDRKWNRRAPTPDAAHFVLLSPGDVIREGDEVFAHGSWFPCEKSIGMQALDWIIRRRAPALSVQAAAQVLLDYGKVATESELEAATADYEAFEDQFPEQANALSDMLAKAIIPLLSTARVLAAPVGKGGA